MKPAADQAERIGGVPCLCNTMLADGSVWRGCVGGVESGGDTRSLCGSLGMGQGGVERRPGGDLWTFDGLPSLDVTVTGGGGWPTVAGGRCVEVSFNATVHEQRPVSIFAKASLRPRPSDGPLMVLVHGGGATCDAFLKWRVEPHLRRGFNVLALDLPGKGDCREGSRSGGPDLTYRMLYRAGEPREAYPWHAVMAVRRTIDAAAVLGCDTSRVLLEGWSWGAVISLLTASVDDRVGGVSAIYGAGHLHRGSIGRDVSRMGAEAAARWRGAFDPFEQSYPEGLSSYLVTASNDSFFALPDNVRTLEALPRAGRHLGILPNVNHATPSSVYAALDGFAVSVAGGGAAPSVRPRGIEWGVNGMRLLLEGSERIEQAYVYAWPLRDITNETIDWTRLRWRQARTAALDDRVIVAASDIEDQLWYVTLICKSGQLASSGLFRGREPFDA